MESAKLWELTADYDAGRRVVTLRLWRRGDRNRKGAAPVKAVDVCMGNGFEVARRIALRTMLGKAGLRPEQVLGA